MAANSSRSIHLEGTTHPSSANRLVAVDNTVKEIKRKKEAREALAPEMSGTTINKDKNVSVKQHVN